MGAFRMYNARFLSAIFQRILISTAREKKKKRRKRMKKQSGRGTFSFLYAHFLGDTFYRAVIVFL